MPERCVWPRNRGCQYLSVRLFLDYVSLCYKVGQPLLSSVQSCRDHVWIQRLTAEGAKWVPLTQCGRPQCNRRSASFAAYVHNYASILQPGCLVQEMHVSQNVSVICEMIVRVNSIHLHKSLHPFIQGWMGCQESSQHIPSVIRHNPEG
jgi:hypothetical protein